MVSRDGVTENVSEKDMSTTQTPDTDTKHVDQSFPFEWSAFEHGDETIVAYDVPESRVECYRVDGMTRNVRAIAFADAVLYEGNIVDTFYDEELHYVVLQHVFAGRKARLRPEEWFDEPVVVLEKCDRVKLE